MKRFRYAAFIALIVLAQVACTMPVIPIRTALVYGVATYFEDHNGRPNLSLTDNDAEDITTLLRSNNWDVTAGIANSNIVLQNSLASKATIEADIMSLEGTEGLVLFYFSGHGGVVGTESVIYPYGSIVPSNTYPYYKTLPAYFITSSELTAMFKNANLKNVIIILDSCNSGGFVDSGATVDAVSPVFGRYNDLGDYITDGDAAYTWFIDSLSGSVKSYISYSNSSPYVVISAAGAGEFSWEGGSNGIFTAAILASQKKLNAADRDGNGYVDTTELYIFCAETINSGWNSIGTYPSSNWDVFFPHLSGTPREYALWATK